MTTLAQTVTWAVPFRRRGRRRTEAATSPPEVAPEVPAGRVPRIARLMALALRFDSFSTVPFCKFLLHKGLGFRARGVAY
jgi:hypothetical protein